MSRHTPIYGALAIGLTLALLTGCSPQQPYYFHDNGDLSHYKKMATEIEYPNANVESLSDVQGAIPPMTLSNTTPKEFWDLKLEEAMRDALDNAKVMKQIGAAVVVQAGSFGPGTPDFLTRNPQGAPTVYDPAVAESDPRFGVETALAAFDAQLAASVLWQKQDRPTNVNDGLPSLPNSNGAAFLNQDDVGTFQAQLKKVNAWGGTTTLTNNVNYLNSNSTFNSAMPSAYNVNVEAAWQQPLLRGGGVEFNRIAGPGGFPGFLQGVMIARVNTDVALATFEANLRNMVSDVENAYWELYFAYRNLDTVQEGLKAALKTWQKTYALSQVGAKGGEAERESQAREEYFVFRASVERALNSMYKAESNLRYMMGIAATDGRLIRPSEEPTTAKVSFDWYAVHNEAMVRSVELRQQKWTIKRRELELIAAKNFLLPQLDAIARYRYQGMGHQLIDDGSSFGAYSGAFNNLVDGQFQEWDLGFQFSTPLGFRKEMSGVRNAQLQLARERSLLQEQELEVSHQMAAAIRDLDGQYVLLQTNYNRMNAAQAEVNAVQAAYDADTVAIDVLLSAQRLLAQAQSDYYRSLVDYTKAIINVHYRKGSLLEYNGICLAEGPWPAKAYFDATRLARARGAAHYMDYGFTKPQVVSRGAYQQNANEMPGVLPNGVQEMAPPVGSPTDGPEVIPAPQSVPNGTPAPPVPAPQQTMPKPSVPQAMGPRLISPQAAVTDPALQPTSYEAAGPALAPAVTDTGWTNTNRTNGSHATDADVSTAATDRTASGWTRAQH
jgi:outer membrane protein TolC